MKVQFKGIPTFAPEHFAVIEQIDSMKRKQFQKGMEQIAEEGAIQIFFLPDSGMERVIVGVVGMLQFDVLKFRLQSEYGVGYSRMDLPHDQIRYIEKCPGDPKNLTLSGDTRRVVDVRGNSLLIFPGTWAVNWALENNEGLELSEFNRW